MFGGNSSSTQAEETQPLPAPPARSQIVYSPYTIYGPIDLNRINEPRGPLYAFLEEPMTLEWSYNCQPDISTTSRKESGRMEYLWFGLVSQPRPLFFFLHVKRKKAVGLVHEIQTLVVCILNSSRCTLLTNWFMAIHGMEQRYLQFRRPRHCLFTRHRSVPPTNHTHMLPDI